MKDEALKLAEQVNQGRDALPKLLDLLPALRDETGWGPKDMENALGGAVERGRISRLTGKPRARPSPDA